MIIYTILNWYLFILLIGTITFILTFELFKDQKDRGYCISKTIGILLVSFISWLAMVYNFNMYSFTADIPRVATGILGIAALIIIVRSVANGNIKEIYKFIDTNYRLILFTEAAFIAILIGISYVRAFAPDILDVHKLQDLVYIKSFFNTGNLPPENIWLAGYKINYYYFGYFLIANLVYLSNIDIHLAFNLVPGTILGLIAISAGGITYNITNSRFYGILGGFLTAFISNYKPLTQIIQSGLQNGYDWWQSTHFLPSGSFTEFPFWTAIHGDLQAYYTVQIIILALIYCLYSSIKSNNLMLLTNFSVKTVIFNILISILLAITIMTNIYSLIYAILLILLFSIYAASKAETKKLQLQAYFLNITAIFITTILILIPFILSYNIPFTGLSFVTGELSVNFIDFLIIFGVFLIPVIIYMLIRLKEELKLSMLELILTAIIVFSISEAYLIYKAKLTSLPVTILSITILACIVLTGLYLIVNKVKNRQSKDSIIIAISIIVLLSILSLTFNNVSTGIIVAAGIFSFYILSKEKDFEHFTYYSLLACSIIILLISNIFYIKTNSETNLITYSYLTIQTLIIFPIILVLSIFLSLKNLKEFHREVYITIVIIIILPALLFLFLGPYYKTNKFNTIEGLIPSISGDQHIGKFHPSDYELIEWLKEDADSNSILIEAIKPGDYYSGRISAYSGMATVLNWPERQYFAYGKNIQKELQQRAQDIDKIYSEPDKTKILQLIKKYNVEYICISELENELYPLEVLRNFSQVATLEYQTAHCGVCVIYKLKRDSAY